MDNHINIVPGTLLPATDAQVHSALIEQSETPLLLNFGAAWCGPCRTFAPTLEEIKRTQVPHVNVMKVDIDASPALATQFRIRGIPATILLQSGQELGRFVGVKTPKSVLEWLRQRVASNSLAGDVLTAQSNTSAFPGGPSTKAFLLDRLYRHFDDGKVEIRFSPLWEAGHGSISGALVHSADPDVFEEVVGMPYGVACAMEFLMIDQKEIAASIFEVIETGADTSNVPLEFIRAFLGHESMSWANALGSLRHDALRREWLETSADFVKGKLVDVSRWASLRQQAHALQQTEDDAFHLLENYLATLIETLSPPPSAFDGEEWKSVLLTTSAFARGHLAEHRAGWSKNDSAMPLLRHRYFEKSVPISADGSYDLEVFNTIKISWDRENSEFNEKENQTDLAQMVSELTTPLRSCLADLLAACRPQ